MAARKEMFYTAVCGVVTPLGRFVGDDIEEIVHAVAQFAHIYPNSTVVTVLATQFYLPCIRLVVGVDEEGERALIETTITDEELQEHNSPYTGLTLH